MSAPPPVHRGPHLRELYSPCTHPAEKSRSHLQPRGAPQVPDFFARWLWGLYSSLKQKKRVFFLAILALLGHFGDLERVFVKNSDFPGASRGRPVVRQAAATPSQREKWRKPYG